DRIQYSTNLDQDSLMESQLSLLSELLNTHRMKRLEFMEAISKKDKIIKDILNNCKLELFKELKESEILITNRRQKLQKAFIGLLVDCIRGELNYEKPKDASNRYMYNDYIKSLFYSRLILLEKEID